MYVIFDDHSPRLTQVLPGLYYYDTVLMFPTEVRLIWRHPPNVASLFYLAIRWSFFFQISLTIFHDVHFTRQAGPTLSSET